jgi:hypothetical protein
MLLDLLIFLIVWAVVLGALYWVLFYIIPFPPGLAWLRAVIMVLAVLIFVVALLQKFGGGLGLTMLWLGWLGLSASWR